MESINVYQYIEEIASQTNYDLSKITIITGNMFEKHDRIKIRNNFPWMYLKWGQENCVKPLEPKQFDHNFKTFALFVSRGNWNRLKLASYLFKNYPTYTVQSYHFDHTNAYHRDNIGVENLINFNYIGRIEDVTNLWKHCPLTLDQVYKYPIINPTGYGLVDHYKHFFVEIVAETYSMGNTFFPTEKIWRPISQLTPFMVQGPQWYIVRLRKLGFKTFEHWWDEGYNEDGYDSQADSIENNIDQLAKLSTDELGQIYNDMLPTLHHNRQRLLELTNSDIRLLNE
jgi:hypothetical protein